MACGIRALPALTDLNQARFIKWGTGNFKIGNTAEVCFLNLSSLCKKNKSLKNMKNVSLVLICLSFLFSCNQKIREPQGVAKKPKATESNRLYLDVHNLEPGKVTFEAVAGAHQKDLAVQGKYGVNFLKYWVDETAGKEYCFGQATDLHSLFK